MGRPIRSYLILLVLAVLLPLVALQGYTLWSQARADLREASQEALARAEVTALETEAVVQEAHTLLLRLAQRPGIRHPRPGECDPIVRDIATLQARYANAWIATPEGHVTCSGLPLPPGERSYRGDQAWFQEALASDGPSVGTPYVGLITGQWVSVQALTLRDAEGRPESVLGLPLQLRALRPAIGVGPLAPGRSVFVVNRTGTIIAHEPDAQDWVGKSLSGPPLQALLDRRHGHRRLTGPDGVEYIYGFAPVGDTGWFAAATIPAREAVGPILREAVVHALAALAVVGLAVLLAVLSARRIARPMRALGAAAQRASEGDLNTRVPTGGPREIGTVAAQFNTMLLRRAQAQDAEARLRRVMEAVRAVQQSYIAESPRPPQVFECILQSLMELSESAFGCVCEVRPGEGSPTRLVLQAYSGPDRDEAERRAAELDLTRPDHLFGAVFVQGRAVLSGGSATCGAGLPLPHPPLHNVLGLPLRWQGRLVGIAVLGNRPDGYTQALVEYLDPLLVGSANIIDAYRSEQRRRAAEEQLAYLSQYDKLTGLPNRHLLRNRLHMHLQNAAEHRHRVAVLVLNLDRFKRVNELLGRAAGDAHLQFAADRLRRSISEADTVARLEGDEFAVVLDRVPDVQTLATDVRRLLQQLARPSPLLTEDIRLTASVGVSVYPNDGTEAELLLQRAELALAHARRKASGAYAFYAPAVHAQAQARLSLENSLRGAIERDELVLLYQPRVELASGRMTGVEALVRWRRGERLLCPEEFVPLAEASELIVPIGNWVLHTACRQGMEWARMGLPPLAVSVNVSPAQLHEGGAAEEVESALVASGLPANRLELEITESLLLEQPETAVDTLTRLRESGVRLSIDDFGTGYSSLAYLKRLPVHKLKIDRSFVRDLNVDPDDEAIVKAIIAMARALHLSVTAEGIETAEQARILKLLDCEEGQGFCYGAPVPAEAIAARLRAAGPVA